MRLFQTYNNNDYIIFIYFTYNYYRLLYNNNKYFYYSYYLPNISAVRLRNAVCVVVGGANFGGGAHRQSLHIHPMRRNVGITPHFLRRPKLTVRTLRPESRKFFRCSANIRNLFLRCKQYFNH